jgi:hypothetical protein
LEGIQYWFWFLSYSDDGMHVIGPHVYGSQNVSAMDTNVTHRFLHDSSPSSVKPHWRMLKLFPV